MLEFERGSRLGIGASGQIRIRDMKGILEEENRKKWEKMIELMALHYHAPFPGPFGSRFFPSPPPSPPSFV